MVKECITVPTFSFLLSGSPYGMIKSKRGLKQGDTLSPCLPESGEGFFHTLGKPTKLLYIFFAKRLKKKKKKVRKVSCKSLQLFA